jgi:hypothetical protein
MITKDGRFLHGYYCAKNSAAEVKSIIEMGIKKGVCSLSVDPDIPVPSPNKPKTIRTCIAPKGRMMGA